MMQDEQMFPEPDTFKPERRFLDTDNPGLQNFTLHFGFGRRICPGMYIANQAIFIVLAHLLWAFDVVPVVGPDGKPVIPSKDDFTSGLITRLSPFPCAFESRGNGVDEFIVLEAERAETEAARWDND